MKKKGKQKYLKATNSNHLGEQDLIKRSGIIPQAAKQGRKLRTKNIMSTIFRATKKFISRILPQKIRRCGKKKIELGSAALSRIETT